MATILAPLLATTPAPAQSTVPPLHTVTLTEALARGRSVGTRAVLARLDAQLAGQRVGIARSALLPSVNGTVSVDRQTLNLDEFGFPGVSGTTDPFDLMRARLGAEQTLFDRQAWSRLAAARDSAVAAGADADRVTALAAAAAGAAWLRLAEAEQLVRAREADSVTAWTLLSAAREQVAAGTAARIEQTRSETRAQVTRNQLSEARHERARAQLDLARAMRLPSESRLTTSGMAGLDFTMPADPDSAVAVALANRRDLAAARTRLKVATEQVHTSSMAYWPTVAARGFVQESGQHADALAPTWSLGLALQWGLFDGLRRHRELDQSRLKADAARIRLDDLNDAVAAQARRAVLDIASANEQMAISRDRLKLALEELGQAEDRFDAGVAGSVETTTAQASVTAARDATIRASISLGAAQLRAASALGLLNHNNESIETGTQR